MNSRERFDLIVGVNTTRYAHRLNRENELAQGYLRAASACRADDHDRHEQVLSILPEQS